VLRVCVSDARSAELTVILIHDRGWRAFPIRGGTSDFQQVYYLFCEKYGSGCRGLHRSQTDGISARIPGIYHQNKDDKAFKHFNLKKLKTDKHSKQEHEVLVNRFN